MEINSILIMIFSAAIYLLIHTYIIYPISILFISMLFKPEAYIDDNKIFGVSIIISVFNEEDVIEKRVRNIANQNIDFSKVELLIGSDGSNDGTNEILSQIKNEYDWIRVFIFDKQRGKAYVLNDLVERTSNDILIFTDANTLFETNSIRKLINGFADNSVGGISGRLILKDQAESVYKGIKERNYWEYETFIKKSEGRCGILIGANGGIYAIRRELFKLIPEDKAVTDDFFVTLSVLSQNRKFKYAYNAIATEKVGPDLLSEFRRKVRIASTNFQTLTFFKHLLISDNLLLSFAFFSHKVIRWFSPFYLLILLLLNIILLDTSSFFRILFAIQISFYSLSAIGLIMSLLSIKQRFLSLLSYFILTNLALLIGFFRYLRGEHSAAWESTPR